MARRKTYKRGSVGRRRTSYKSSKRKSMRRISTYKPSRGGIRL